MKKVSIILFLSACFLLLSGEGISRFYLLEKIKHQSEPIIINHNNPLISHLAIDPKYKSKKYSGKVPHPYFGYLNKSNNFEEVKNYKKQRHLLKVGIFGGSVAADLFNLNLESKKIQKVLSQIFKISENNIRIINFSSGGYRQPQQHNISAIYGDYIDLAINIEGSNEMTYFYEKKFPHYFPHYPTSKLFFTSVESLALIPNLIQLVKSRGDLAEKLLTQSYTLKITELIDLLHYAHAGRSIDRTIKQLRIKDHIFFKGSNHKPYKAYKQLKFWLKMSCLQQNSMAARNINNFFYVQPIPYLFKSLSPEEKKVVSDIDNIQKKTGKLLAELDFQKISETGLNIESMMKIFSNNSKDIYIDSCCHMNKNGYNDLLTNILSHLKKVAKNPPRSCNYRELMVYLENFNTY